MLEDKSFTDFYAKLSEIVNSRFNLGKKSGGITNRREDSKILPERFCLKVTTI